MQGVGDPACCGPRADNCADEGDGAGLRLSASAADQSHRNGLQMLYVMHTNASRHMDLVTAFYLVGDGYPASDGDRRDRRGWCCTAAGNLPVLGSDSGPVNLPRYSCECDAPKLKLFCFHTYRPANIKSHAIQQFIRSSATSTSFLWHLTLDK